MPLETWKGSGSDKSMRSRKQGTKAGMHSSVCASLHEATSRSATSIKCGSDVPHLLHNGLDSPRRRCFVSTLSHTDSVTAPLSIELNPDTSAHF